jgi:diaminohydroxyphosphoribosylaminopyrimidine deaminase / 5-amino-6-(5-phosphoribosylamino)uracil reductase
MKNEHEFFMRKVLKLAEKGRGFTSPNPMVGALIVKNGKIIAAAYHERAGAMHAEAAALKKAGKSAEGASLYVNLEPCSHVGRTPPCTDVIIKSKIRKVFYSIIDPNPLNNGRGIRILKKNNIEARGGILENEARELNKIFIKYITKKIPFVSLKSAESLDGKIAAKTGDSKWITSEASRSRAHRLRAASDAILVGVNTVIKDDPLLTSRMKRSPVKVILDPSLRVPEKSRVFSEKSPSLSIVAVLKKSLDNKKVINKIRRLNKKGVLIMICPARRGRLDLKYLMRELADLEVSNLLIEGGGDTASGFLEEGLVDRVFFFIAPKIIGGRDALTPVEGDGVKRVGKAVRLKNMEVERIGEDILIKADIFTSPLRREGRVRGI